MRNTYLQQCDYGSRFRILKGGKIALVVSAFIAGTTLLHAAPSGGVVTSGTANIAQSGTITNITQASQKASINWTDFSIKANETVNFNQPNASAITLNRVVGNERSVIDGALNANGQVWLLNSNGVLFGKNASINTAGLLATTSKLSDADFNAGNYNFTDASSNSIINLGTITISDKGYAVLTGKEVENQGNIIAVQGKVHLVGAEQVSINLNGNSLLNLRVDKGTLDAIVKNSGSIKADGGEVYLTTNAVDELLKGVVNNTGVIEAQSFDEMKGKIELFAHGGEVQVGGTLNAKEGFIETSGKDFAFNDAKIDAGKWLIDPVNITIDSSLAGAIEAQLGTGDVNIETGATNTPSTTTNESGADGNIYVNSAITWNSDKKLTLNAWNDIFINQSITATNAAGKLELFYGQKDVATGNTADYHVNAKVNLKAGQNFSTMLGNDGTLTDWTVLTDAATMHLMTLKDANMRYVLGADLSLTGTNNWDPIGDNNDYFTGKFDGLGHTISNLNINDAIINGFDGIFGFINGATIKNISVVDAIITGAGDHVGVLAGSSSGSSIKNISVVLMPLLQEKIMSVA